MILYGIAFYDSFTDLPILYADEMDIRLKSISLFKKPILFKLNNVSFPIVDGIEIDGEQFIESIRDKIVYFRHDVFDDKNHPSFRIISGIAKINNYEKCICCDLDLQVL